MCVRVCCRAHCHSPENLGMLRKAIESLEERSDIVRISTNVDTDEH